MHVELTIRVSNACPSWPHEYVVTEKRLDYIDKVISQVTYPMDNLHRILVKAYNDQESYIEKGYTVTIKIEQIICRVTSLNC